MGDQLIYHECEKFAEIADKWNDIEEFLDVNGYELSDGGVPVRVKDALADHFSIDLKVLEAERRQMLDSL